MVLNAIYEEDFLGYSYGFRPGLGPHDALDALSVRIPTKPAMHSNLKPATYSNAKPAGLPI